MAKILVIDDDKDILELMQFVFKQDGHDVLTAKNGEDGLASASEAAPDLIILDVMMPGMDGYTVSTRLLENDKTRNIPVIILTAKGQMRSLFAMAPNVIHYMEKPFDAEELQTKVRARLGTSKKMESGWDPL